MVSTIVIDRFLRLKSSIEPLQCGLSRQDGKGARKISSYMSELGVLCVLARVIPFPSPTSELTRKFQLSLARTYTASKLNRAGLTIAILTIDMDGSSLKLMAE
jgi:hypothetical protein